MELKEFCKACTMDSIMLATFDDVLCKWTVLEKKPSDLIDDESTIVETYVENGKIHVSVVDYQRQMYGGLASLLCTVHDTDIHVKRKHINSIYLAGELTNGCWVNTQEMNTLEQITDPIERIYLDVNNYLVVDYGKVISADKLRDAIDALVQVLGHSVILTYAQEILEPDFGEYIPVNDLDLTQALLNGAYSWKQYSEDDSLVWDEDIATRIVGDKKAQPHDGKTWTDIQADYLHRACCLICEVAKAGR